MITTLRRIISVVLTTLICLVALPIAALAELRADTSHVIAAGGTNTFAADGSRVLYHDAPTRTLHLYDASTGEDQSMGASLGQVTTMALLGDKAAYVTLTGWDQDPNGPVRMEHNLFLHDLTSGETTKLGSGVEWGPLMASGKLVWATGSSTTTIFSYDLTTGEKAEVAQANLYRNGPVPLHFDGRYVAWREGQKLVAVDLTTGERHTLDVTWLNKTFALDDGRVLYRYNVSYMCEAVGLWDIATGTVTRQANSDVCGPNAPAGALRGDLLALASSGGNYAITIYHLPTGQRVHVGADSREKLALTLTDDLLVYWGWQNGQSALVAVPLTFGEPPATEWNTPYGKEFISDIGPASIDGERILYATQAGSHLMLRNLDAGTEREIASDAAGYDKVGLSGGWAAYSSVTAEGPGIYVHRLDSVERNLLLTDFVLGPYLGDGGLIWAERTQPSSPPDGTGETLHHAFFLQEPSTGRRRQIGYFDLAQVTGRNVVHSGTHLAWTEPGQDGTQLISQDLLSGERSVIQVEGDAEVLTAERERAIVARYPTGRDGVRTELMHWNLRTGKLLPETAPFGVVREAVLRGNRLAWIKQEGERWTVETHDLLSGRTGEPVLTTTEYPVSELSLSDRHLFVKAQGALVVVPLEQPGPEPAPEPTPEPTYYTVQSGDFLWKVALKFKLSLTELIRSNNMVNPHVLHPGDKLYLPSPHSPATEQYTVQSGDTLAGIAAKYKTDVSNLQRQNEMGEGTQLNPGQTLQVSRGPQPEAGWSESERPYAVMPGDTLWNIAKRAWTTVTDLVKTNNWSWSVQLKIGDLIRIPGR